MTPIAVKALIVRPFASFCTSRSSRVCFTWRAIEAEHRRGDAADRADLEKFPARRRHGPRAVSEGGESRYRDGYGQSIIAPAIGSHVRYQTTATPYFSKIRSEVSEVAAAAA